MNYCQKCKVQVLGKMQHCPLCGNELIENMEESEEQQEEVFPYFPTLYKQYHMLFRILLFISVVCIVVSVTVNSIFRGKGWWSLAVAGGVGCLWIILYVAVKKRKNIPKNMLYQWVVISILCALWDAFTGWSGWSIDYIIPVICMAAMVALVVVNKIMKLKVEDYMIYIILGGLFGLVPAIFLLFGLVHVTYLSLICVAAAIIFLAAVFIFQGELILEEIKRRLHW